MKMINPIILVFCLFFIYFLISLLISSFKIHRNTINIKLYKNKTFKNNRERIKYLFIKCLNMSKEFELLDKKIKAEGLEREWT